MNTSIIEEEIKFNDPNYSWIKFSRSFVSFKDAKIIKGESTKEFEEQLIEQAQSGSLACFEPYSNLYYKEQIPEKELDVIVNPSVDTIVFFDPNTNIEKIEPIESFGINSEDIIGIKAHQYWYIDPARNTLDVQLVAIDLVVKDKEPIRKGLNIKLPFRVFFF